MVVTVEPPPHHARLQIMPCHSSVAKYIYIGEYFDTDGAWNVRGVPCSAIRPKLRMLCAKNYAKNKYKVHYVEHLIERYPNL